MTTTRFTPGPWLVKDGFTEEFEVYAETPDNFGYYEIAEIKCMDGETSPNAHLIAAAPDLYEALENAAKLLKYVVEEYPGHAPDLHKCNAALAKAEGKS